MNQEKDRQDKPQKPLKKSGGCHEPFLENPQRIEINPGGKEQENPQNSKR